MARLRFIVLTSLAGGWGIAAIKKALDGRYFEAVMFFAGGVGFAYFAGRACIDALFGPEDESDVKAAREVREGLKNGTETTRPLAEFRQETGL